MKIKFILGILLFILFPALTFSQTNTTESLSFTTYFPSPNAVFDKMEVRSKLVVGNITDSNSAVNGIAVIGDLKKDQVFVTDSIILGSQTLEPTPAIDGQIFFNNSTGVQKLEFYNGSWQQLGSP
jgi:hypothetical protein